MPVTRVALVDIDDCLVSNSTSALNNELISELVLNGYDSVWLFSGRNGADTWRHVLKLGTPHKNWKDQLITSLLSYLESEHGIKGNVSLPYDHVLDDLAAGSGFVASGLALLESKLLDVDRPDEALSLIRETTADLDEHVMFELAIHDDMNKRGQCEHLIKHLQKEYPDSEFDISIFDDREENLITVASHLERIPSVSSVTTSCVTKFTTPEAPVVHADYADTLDGGAAQGGGNFPEADASSTEFKESSASSTSAGVQKDDDLGYLSEDQATDTRKPRSPRHKKI